MIAALLLAAQVPPNFPAATPSTIEQVRAYPRAWDGRWVRIQGYVQRCTSIDCLLTEGPGGSGLSLSFEAAPSFDAWVAPQLPARLEVTARIDAACLVDHICTDRAPVLRQVYVRALPNHLPAKE